MVGEKSAQRKQYVRKKYIKDSIEFTLCWLSHIGDRAHPSCN